MTAEQERLLEQLRPLIERDYEWVGGTLIDLDENAGGRFASTRILAIDTRGSLFCVHGIGFNCEADARYLHVTVSARQVEFTTPWGGHFTIEKENDHVV